MAVVSSNDIRKITRGFQITLPKFFREKNNLNVGDLIEVLQEGDSVLLRSVKREEDKEKAIESLLNILEEPVSEDFKEKNEEEIVALIDKERGRKI